MTSHPTFSEMIDDAIEQQLEGDDAGYCAVSADLLNKLKERLAPLTPADVQVGDWVLLGAQDRVYARGNLGIVTYGDPSSPYVDVDGRLVPRVWITEVRRG